MATISKRKRGGWEIRFIDGNGKRRSFYPGNMPKAQAESIKRHVSQVVSARKASTAIPDSTASWLASNPAYRQKLHLLGIIEAPEQAKDIPTLASQTASYIESRSDVKDSTITVWKRCQRHLVGFFGEVRKLDEITVGCAKDFQQHLLKKGLSDNTTRKMCSIACQIFADAIDREYLTRNPFKTKAIPRTIKTKNDRKFFVTREVSEKILESLPTLEWKIIFALSRWGGLRCPSEVTKLQFDHILWDQKRVIVPSPKTEHHEGHEQRLMPLFPELEPLLSQAYHEAPEGAVYLVRPIVNPGVALKKMILRGGVKPWPKIFHNMRSTRQTELERLYGVKAACSWLGNSIRVADASYLQVPESTWDEASKCTPKCTPERNENRQNQAESTRT